MYLKKEYIVIEIQDPDEPEVIEIHIKSICIKA